MLKTSQVSVDLSAVERNVATLREALGASGGDAPARLCAVIKADAYGLGAVRLAHRLEMCGVEMLGVYTLDEAVELLGASVRTPILVMSPVRSIADSDALYRAVSHGRLHFSTHSLEQAEALGKQADRFGVEIPAHLDLNTGMNRGGISLREGEEILEFVTRHRRMHVAGVSTHFASAESDGEATAAQAERFERWLEEMGERIPKNAVRHEANTFGLFRSRRTHQGMVRVGLALAGYAVEEMSDPEAFEFRELAERLDPAVRWTSEIAHVQWIDAGERVGYGGTFTAERRTRVALAPVGYADGYPHSLSGRGIVRVGSGDELFEAPLIGRVSMDQITIDATDLPGEMATVGATVELIGTDREAATHLPTVARTAGTISHEILCRLGRRAPKRYASHREHAGATVVTRRPPTAQRA
jgi:alanine racemase